MSLLPIRILSFSSQRKRLLFRPADCLRIFHSVWGTVPRTKKHLRDMQPSRRYSPQSSAAPVARFIRAAGPTPKSAAPAVCEKRAHTAISYACRGEAVRVVRCHVPSSRAKKRGAPEIPGRRSLPSISSSPVLSAIFKRGIHLFPNALPLASEHMEGTDTHISYPLPGGFSRALRNT